MMRSPGGRSLLSSRRRRAIWSSYSPALLLLVSTSFCSAVALRCWQGRGAFVSPISSRISSLASQTGIRRRSAGVLESGDLSSDEAAQVEIVVLYDGLCKVCLTNKALLESQDTRGVLRFVNIADDDYDSRKNANIEYEDAMDELHIILPGGEIIKGVPAVHRAYEAVGLDWAVSILGSSVLRGLTDAAYRFVSENRQDISRYLPSLDGIHEQLRSARFLQKGVAEGEGCSVDLDIPENSEEECHITDEEFEETLI